MRILGITAALLGLAGSAASQVHLNELYISHAGTDTLEFIELVGAPGTLLDGVVVCVVEGDGPAAGTLDRAYNLTGLSIPASGYFVMGDTAVVPKDFALAASDSLENGTETLYVVSTANVAGITSLVGTSIIASGTATQLPSLGTILDVIGVVDGGFPATDAVFDGTLAVGPDAAGFFPAGILRGGDFPANFCTSEFLDFDPAINLNLPRTPGAPNSVTLCLPDVHFTELVYNGNDGEFVEVTNLGAFPANLSGFVFEDDSFNPANGFPLGSVVLAPGESLVITEELAEDFRASWELAPSVQIVGGNGNNLGRNDSCVLYDALGNLVTSVDFGDQDFPGSFRSENLSIWPHVDGVQAADTTEWEASFVGDDQGSAYGVNGDIANPGSWTQVDSTGRGEWRGLGFDFGGDIKLTLAAGGEQVDSALIGLRLWDNDAVGSVPLLVVGFTNLSVPLKGGTLVPSVNFLFPVPVNSLGNVDIATSWPAGIPSGFELYYQAWVADAGAQEGFSSSNAVSSITR
jgi:hypothetical protein